MLYVTAAGAAFMSVPGKEATNRVPSHSIIRLWKGRRREVDEDMKLTWINAAQKVRG
jgi:hypothetical protein